VVRLHLGCGKKKLPDYINIDGFEPSADLVADVRKLPYEDNSVDEILAIHVFEHFEYWEAEDIAREWFRVIRPGGVLIMEMPSFDKTVKLLKDNTPKSLVYALLALYGDWKVKRPEMTHKWCWQPASLAKLLKKVGFSEVKLKDPQTHVKCRDFRIEGAK
jgi:predicted SAM-dependent methyltransferase